MSDDEHGGCPDETNRQNTFPASTEPLSTDGGQISHDDRQQQLATVFQSLSSQRRRYVLYELRASGVSNLDSLATHVEAAKQDIQPTSVSDDDREQSKVQLVHADMPYLENAGLVEYDRRSEAVCYADPIGYLDSIIQLCEEIDAPPDRAE